MKISVIIPTFNRFNYLLNAINSVHNQTHKDIEIIIINDCSSQKEYYDNILETKIKKDDKIINLDKRSESVVGNNGRAAYTRNVGIKEASGDYIAFLDDDDVWFPDKIKLQLEYMNKNNTKMCCAEALTGNGIFDKDKKYKLYNAEQHKDFFIHKNIIHPDIWDEKFLEKHNSCITSTVIIATDIIRKIGYMNYIRVGEDYDYWLRALKYTNCSYINIPLVYYDRNHGDGSLY